MAEKAQSLEDEIKCLICGRQYEDPRILPCLHTYCRKCLEDLLDKGTIQCPGCGLKIERVEDISSRFKIDTCVRRNLLSFDVSRICNNCDPQKSAKASCFNCKKSFCDECITAHEHLEELKDHQVFFLSLNDTKNDAVPPFERSRLCPKHEVEIQKLFCDDCKELVCNICAKYDHEDHIGLEFITDDVIEKNKESLRGEIKGVNNTIEKIGIALKKIQLIQESVIQNIETVELEVDDKINAEIKRLEDLRSSLKRESRSMAENKMSKLFSKQEKVTENRLANGSDLEVLSMVKQLTLQLAMLQIERTADKIEMDGEGQLELFVDSKAPSGNLGVLKIKDGGVPDPTMCEISEARGEYKGKDCIIIHIKNFKGKAIKVKKDRIKVNGLPCDVSLVQSHDHTLSDAADTSWMIVGHDFKLPTKIRHGNCELEILIDGQPIKKSPVKVYVGKSTSN